jgi:predicted DsbA family dithiol-disulfide isomerase
MPLQVRYYTDPACPWSWATEPKLRRLIAEFGDELRFSWVMGGLARSYGPDYRDTGAGITGERNCFDGLMSHWLDTAAETGMPMDPRIWRVNPISSSYPACQGVKAAAEQGRDAAYAYLRRTREALMIERKKLDHVEALVGEAGPAGLDVERFRLDLSSNAITEAFAADLDAVRDVPEEAREQGKTKITEGRERLSFPSMLFVGDDSQHGVWGWQPYERYRDAALAAGASSAGDGRLEPLEAIERFGRCATRELEELSGRPRPVLEAELWRLATEWKLRPVPGLTGTLWELA